MPPFDKPGTPVGEGAFAHLQAGDPPGPAGGSEHAPPGGDAAFLFSSDEEANDPRCIASFLARGPQPYEAVLVAEPTLGEAVLAHRGISSVLMTESICSILSQSSAGKRLRTRSMTVCR